MARPLPIRLVIIIQDGRLGNQFYQFFHGAHLATHGVCLIFGMDNISPFFSAPNVLFVSHILPQPISSLFLFILLRIRFFLRAFLRFFPIVSFLPNQSLPPIPSFTILPGIISSILFFDDLNYASSSPLCASVSCHPISYTTKLYARIAEFDKRLTTATNVKVHNRYFVHVRRGDYLLWPSPDSPAALPISWYFSAMSQILTFDPQAHFILLSDDPQILCHFDLYYQNLTFLSSSPFDDFVAMLSCGGGGILSPSSFSFWAAFLSKSHYTGARYIAPKYWLGWSSGEWLPSHSCQPWLSYLIVDPPS